VAPIATGDASIPALSFRAEPLDADAPPVTAQSTPIDATIVSLLAEAPDGFQPATILPPVEPAPPPGFPIAETSLGVAAALAVVAILAIARLMRKQPASALARLRARAHDIASIPNHRDRARAAAAIAREALAVPLGPRARAATTAELDAMITGVPAAMRADIVAFLDRAEAICYAPAPPPGESPDPLHIIDLAKGLIDARDRTA